MPKLPIDPRNYESTITPEMRRSAVPDTPRRMVRVPAAAPEPEETPRSRRAAGDGETAAGTALIAEGREGAQQIKNAIPSNYPETYVIPDVGDSVPTEPQLIKFVPGIAVPTVIYAEHWCGAPSGWITEGKRSFVCLGSTGTCPLCDIGDSPRKWEVYNVLDLRNPEQPLLRILKAAKALSATLMTLDRIPRSNPAEYGTLAREDMYWQIWRINNLPGDKAIAKTELSPVKARDLYEDWGFESFTTEELAEWTKRAWPKEKIIQASSWKELKAAADAAP